jgi:hypothetical protein
VLNKIQHIKHLEDLDSGVDINSAVDIKEEFPDQWKESSILAVYKMDDAVIVVGYQYYQFHTKFYPTSFLEIVDAGFDITYKPPVGFSAFVRYLRKNGDKMRQCIGYS